MKRTFNEYASANIPDYLIKIANAIKEKNNIILILSKIIGDDIDSAEYLIDNLNIIMDNKLIKYHIDKDNINLIYKYNSTLFNIVLEYSDEIDMYRIICNTY